MLKRILLGALAALTVTSVAFAQSSVLPYFYNSSNVKVPVGSGNPLPVTGSFSATLAGFAPNGNYGTLTATAASSVSTSLPAGEVVALQNTSQTVDVSCVLDPTSAVATTNKIVVHRDTTQFVTVGLNTKVACINQTGSASNLVALMGGTGLGTNFGAGGGGGAVTLASGAVASGAYSAGSIAAGAVVAGAFVDGADLTQGATADAVCATATGTCSVVSLLKYLNSAVNSSIPAGTALIGDVNLRQGGTALSATNGIYSNLLQGNAVISATNGLYNNLLQGNAVISATNGIYANQLQGNAVLSATNPTFAAPIPTTAGGLSVYNVQPAASDNHIVIKAGAGQVYKIEAFNNSATVNYVRLYNATTGFNGCNSATNLVWQGIIPASTSGAGLSSSWDSGMAFATGISICVTSGYAQTDTTNATASALIVNVGYK